MAHEIDRTTGEAAVFVTGTPAWHRLGKVIASAATSAEAIKLALLDWKVEKRNLAAALPGGGWAPVPDRFGVVRMDTQAVLGVVSDIYRPFQNDQAFDFMDEIVGDKLAMYETAGALRGGKQVWMMARIPKEYRIGKDVVEPYVLLTNSHDGQGSLRMIPTTVRVVCQNTLNLALRGAAGGLSLPHLQKLDQRVNEARAKLGIIGQRLDQFGQEMAALADRKLTSDESKGYFDSLFPTRLAGKTSVVGTDGASLLSTILEVQSQQDAVVDDLLRDHLATSELQSKRNRNILNAVLENYEAHRNNFPGADHSAWSAYNAVSEWADHQKKVTGHTDTERADNQLNSIWFGSANEVKQTAYASALAMAK